MAARPRSESSVLPQAVSRESLDLVEQALRGLRYGQITLLVQDGVIVQIDRTEKQRLN